jgi:hypothetical protein
MDGTKSEQINFRRSRRIIMNYKKITATLLATTLVVANCVPALADGATQNVTGTGAVEVDNSEAVSYYKVTLPSLVASNYNMTLDPTKQLKKYDAVTYAADKTVYFTKTTTPVQLDVNATKGEGEGAKVQYKVDAEATNDEVKAFVTGATCTNGVVTAVTVDTSKEFWVWIPDTTTGNEGLGKPEKLTESNMLTYFDVAATEADSVVTVNRVTMKTNHLANGVVCADKVYKSTLIELPANCDLDAHDKYYDKTGNEITGTDLKTVAAVTTKTDSTDSFTITNKSTQDLELTATVTLNNAKDLDMNPSATFANDNAKASLYVAVTDDTDSTNIRALSKATEDATTASAVLTIPLNKPTITEIRYQGDVNENTGGHDYKRYEAWGTQYNPGSFSITAAANSNSIAEGAWADYAKTITAEAKRPTLNVVYTLAPKTQTVTVTIKNKGDYTGDDTTKTMTVGSAAVAPDAVEGYTFVKYYTDATCETEFTGNIAADTTTLYAKWEAVVTNPSIKSASLTAGTETNSYVKPTNTEATTNSTIEIDCGSCGAVTSVQFKKNDAWATFSATQTNAVWTEANNTLTMKDSYLAGKDSGFQIRFVFDDDESTALVVTFE